MDNDKDLYEGTKEHNKVVDISGSLGKAIYLSVR